MRMCVRASGCGVFMNFETYNSSDKKCRYWTLFLK